jgi:hypothetical protein
VPPPGAPAAWITEEVAPIPKNIYGVTKAAAEDLCQLFHRNSGLPCLVLRTSRFFPEADDSKEMRDSYSDDNIKANEYLHRRVDIEDVVSAHLLAGERAPGIGFRKYIVSATAPFLPEDLAELRLDAPAWSDGASRAIRLNMSAAVGRCSPASSASMTTAARDRSSAGDPGMTSSTSSAVSKQAKIREAPWPWPSARRDITRAASLEGPIRSTRPSAQDHDKDLFSICS